MKTALRAIVRNKSVYIDIGFILFVFCTICVIFTLHSTGEVITFIIEWNRGWKWSHSWWELYLIYFFEIFFLILLWDLILYRSFFVVQFIYRELTHCLIRKRWLLVKSVRVKYGFEKLYYYLRPGMIKRYNQKTDLIDEIISPRLPERIKFTFIILGSFNSIFAAALTFLTYDKSQVENVKEIIKINWSDVLNFLWGNFSKLSTVVVLVLLIFLWYFVSRFGVIRRAIAQANKKKLEDVIQLFRKLDEPISNVIIKGSENIQYALNCYDLILEFWTFNKFPSGTIEGHYLETDWEREGPDYFLFKDIPELINLLNELEQLSAPENKKSMQWFSSHKFELIKFINITSIRVSDIDEYYRLLFTKKGFSKMAERKRSKLRVDNDNQVDESKVKEERDFFIRHVLNRDIIEGIELLYVLYRYTEVINSLLHMESDKLGRGVRLFTGKE